ncbi:Inner membrane protein yohC [Serratia rubidaea]|uniref:Yip1 family protein n=1 Tax=Serratia rubidaea TaxID=61652 RepID=UPI00092FCA18|nr:Yip1 family protein [Serratia rubidaea]QPR61837.1 YIP1 family protein [Serratia rubidaea]CAI0933211.1 Inner membrane protein yohC [Serratia rubidaea]CAI1752934.1 Inner membrane protein yohC [Serratia rubidaea]HAY0636695.1 YIP1 family protein [Serratia rubidaea]
MINHVWGLLAHPSTEFKEIKRENESVSHLYTHHVLLMALIPVVCAFIGTTQLGWLSGAGHAIRLDMPTALYTAAAFYLLILAGVAVMGKVIHWMARRYEARPSLHRCMVFAGYIATPMFLSGIVALYPVVWLCLFVGVIGLCYSGYLLYLGIPHFLNIDSQEGFLFSSSTFAIGILLLELLLGLTVLLWGYGSWLF